MLHDEYYIIERENNDAYPLFSWDQPRGGYGLGRPVEYKEPVKLRLGEPIPPAPVFVDFHEAPNPVVSNLLANVLVPLDIYGIQIISAKVRNPEDKSPFTELQDYWLVHVWNRITCLDKENSELELYDDGTIFGIEKLILDENKLGLFELRKRLIFELTENTSVLLIHQTIKDVIESVNPKGCRFFKASEWYSDIVFD